MDGLRDCRIKPKKNNHHLHVESKKMIQMNLCTKTEIESQNLKTNLQLPKGKD